MNFDAAYVLEVLREIFPFIPITLFIAIVAMLLSCVVGLFIALVKESKSRLLEPVIALYVSFFRSIPTVVELFIIYYGLPQLFPSFNKMEALTATIIGLSLKNAAYLSEIFRAGLQSVAKGQYEACLVVGLSRFHTYKNIILPQAFCNALPGMSNIFISLIKETSLAFTLGLVDLFAHAKLMASDSFRYFEAYLAVAIVFWVLVLIFSNLQTRLELRLNRYH